jgi:two-component system chemotaxis response regulator CheB
MTHRYEELFPGGLEAIALGGSAGAFTVLRTLLPALPGTFTTPILLVVHLPPDRPSAMAGIFGKESALPCREAEDKEQIAASTIYCAPPGYHMLVEADRSLALSVDEPVHFSRPSIDVLFESAADVFRERLMGIVFSGASEDGAAGLKAIHDAGGVTIVQSPETAESPTMPESAIRACPPTFVMTPPQIVDFLRGLGRSALAGGRAPGGGHAG